jgi:hypothetical protein
MLQRRGGSATRVLTLGSTCSVPKPTRASRKQLTSWSGIFLEKLPVAQISDNIALLALCLFRQVSSANRATLTPIIWWAGGGHTGSIYNFRDWCCHLYNCSSAIRRCMIVLANLWGQCTKFHATGGCTECLRPFIWSSVCGLMRFRDGSNKETASNVVQISEKVGRRPWKWIDKRSRKKP